MEQGNEKINSLVKMLKKIWENFKENNIENFAKREFPKDFKPYEEDQKIIQDIIGHRQEFVNNNMSYTYLIATIIDTCYSTQVRRFNDICKVCECISEKESVIVDFIESHDSQKYKEHISQLVNKIKDDIDIDKIPFSFITKYFALHGKRFNKNADALPIYDKYVQMYINAYFFGKGNKNFDKKNVNYLKFYESMDEIRTNTVGDFDQLDKKIWFTAKCIQSAINEEKPSKKELEELLDKHLLFLDKKDYDDKYFENVIRDIKNSIKE